MRAKKYVEREVAIVHRRINIERILLTTIATAGVLSVALLVPNATQVLKLFDGGKRRIQNPKYLLGTAFEKLLLRDYICIIRSTSGNSIKLTEAGEEKLATYIAMSPRKSIPKRWDKRWRVVTYDIREINRGKRRALSELLKAYGFYKLQNSLWIYPYDTESLVILLKARYKLGSEVLYGVMEKIENDTPLREHFKLK